jgi:aldehyde:ferredoxin oxidoreductase
MQIQAFSKEPAASPDFGYAGEILKIDLSEGRVDRVPTAAYAERFIGGHGIAARLYWELVPPRAGAFDAENCLICASGPAAGFPGFAASRWKICGKTPLGDPESFSYGNLGGSWGIFLKYAGYDALVVRGKADRPVYVYIDNNRVEIHDASRLWGQTTFAASAMLKAELGKGVNVLTIGPAAENLLPFATVLAEGGASASGGLGAVMGSKNLKAITVAGDQRPLAAHPERVRELARLTFALRPNLPKLWAVPGLTRPHACYGCGIGCTRETYRDARGNTYKSLCQASNFYQDLSKNYTGRDDGEHLLATRLIDGYGLDSSVMESLMGWLEACYKEGLIGEEETGLPFSRIGSPEFFQELARKVAYREGFGAVLSGGVIAAASALGPRAQGLLPRVVATRGSEKKDYDPRLLITPSLLYATEPRRPIQQLHEAVTLVMMWLGKSAEPGSAGEGGPPGQDFSNDYLRRVSAIVFGSESGVDFSTYEGKALAAKMVQDRVYARESLVLCDLHWTMSQADRVLAAPEKGVTESQVYAAITGKELDDAGLNRVGERIFNLQRAILLRQGWPGRAGDRLLDYFFTEPLKQGELFYDVDGLVPGKGDEVISRLGAVVERDKFEAMKTEYYGRRGWDAASGLPTRETLARLELGDVAADLESRGLLATRRRP